MRHMKAVDGLRAVAVLAVVAYHAGLPVPAGFVGVDVFFVISGYLITRLLHDEVQATGRIDFMAFYARRARRILPALVVVLLATLAASSALLTPAELQQTFRSAAAAFVFAGNLFFSLSPTGYFDPSPDKAPLLHLWSLGVEEQFYLVWPVVLILARRKPVAALAVLAVASLALWLLLPAQAAFYQMPARAWELALGGLVALRPFAVPKGSAWAGLSLVLLACFVPFGHFPGVGVIGAALLIAAIQNGERCALLETRPMVGVGLISYSLYLWHWPLLLLGKGWLPIASLVALAFVLSVLSYWFVETPFRRARMRPRVAVACAVLVVVAGSAGAMTWRTPAPDALPAIYAMGCDDWNRSATVKPCEFGHGKTVVVLGDSAGLQWFPALAKVYAGWHLVVLTKSSCPMVDESFVYARIGKVYANCDKWRAEALRRVAAMKPDLVILGSTYDYPFTQEQWTQGTARVLRGISAPVRILRATPILGDRSGRRAQVNGWLDDAARGLPNVRLVELSDLARPDVYRDPQHLSAPFVASLAEPLAARLK